MATIQENLQKIINSKAAIKNSINAKGGTITDSTPLDEYATAIDNLSSGGNSYVKLLSDEEVNSRIINKVYLYNGESFIKKIDLSTMSESYKSNFLKNDGLGNYSSYFSPSYQNNSLEQVIIGDGTYSINRYRFRGYRKLFRFTMGGFTSSDPIGVGSFDNCVNMTNFMGNTTVVFEGSHFADYAMCWMGYNAYRETPLFRGKLGTIQFNGSSGSVFNSESLKGANFSKAIINATTINYRSCGILGTEVEVGNLCTTLSNIFLEYSGSVLPLDETSTRLDTISDTCNVTTLVMKPTVPPTVSGGAFSTVTTNSLQHVYVPAASLQAYKTATNWSELASIIEANPNE